MKKYSILCMLLVAVQAFGQQKDYRITSHGAVADGKTNNARVLQALIDKVSAQGGGRVIVPPGNFLTGSIFLKSNVELHLEAGAALLGPFDRNEYVSDFDRPALVAAVNQRNVAISGKGIVDGQGQELMLDIFKKLRSGEMKQDSIWRVKRPVGRTMVLQFTSCRNVRVTGITVKNASDWVQDYRECDSVLIDGITVQSTAYWNNDGIDITDSKNVTITNCFVNASDDGICLKSENPKSSCENVRVENCVVRSSASGFKLGTASAGGFKNIVVRNLTVFDTYRSAIALECVDGGNLENINIQNVVARNTGNTIFIRRGHRNKEGKVGTLKGVYIANVKGETPLYKADQGYPLEGPPDHLKPGVDKMPKRPSHYHIYGHPWLPYNLIPSSIVGIPGYPVQDVILENIEISYGGRASKNIAHIPLNAIGSVPENEAAYPEFSMFGELPSWGMYVRHAEGITFKNVKLNFIEADFRPAMVFDDARKINISGLSVPTYAELPMILLNNTSETTLKNLKLPVSETQGIQKSQYR